MRWIRLLAALMAARYRKKLEVNETSELFFRVWITDVDASIMNHAAMMTVMEAGRIDLMVRTGFFRMARRNKWYFPSSGISVQFFRPLKVFQRASLVTRLVYADEKWIYIEQRVCREGKDIAFCLVRGKIKKQRSTLNAKEIITQLGGELPGTDAYGMIRQYEEHLQFLQSRLSSNIEKAFNNN
jgi:acyl-CoA thioesterase FadM